MRASFWQRAKAAYSVLSGERRAVRPMRAEVYGGATVGRLTRDWIAETLSPDAETRYDIRTLRARARQLVRDTSLAAGYCTEYQNQVIGPNGIQLQAKVKNRGGALALETNKEIERSFKEWGRPATASADRRTGWVDQQRMVARTLPMDGEVFAHRLKYHDNAFGFTIRLIDPDLLDETYNESRRGGREIRMGVEVDAWGGPVQYWFWNRHPYDFASSLKLERVPISAAEVTHLFKPYRSGATRGVTWFAPVLFDLKMLAGYREAELVAARMSAAKMGFLVQKDGEGPVAVATAKEGQEPLEMETSPGVIEELPPGWEFQGFDPTHPSTAYDSYEKAITRGIARGLGMSYTSLSGDLTAVNYSSIRAGVLSERDLYKGDQQWFAEHFCRPVYLDFLSMAMLTGQMKVDARLASEYDEVEWQGRGWKWVDPLNDLQAAKLAIDLGLDTRHRQAAEGGFDFEDNLEQLADELQKAKAAGVDVSGNQQKAAAEDPNERDDRQSRETSDRKPATDQSTTEALTLRRRRAS